MKRLSEKQKQTQIRLARKSGIKKAKRAKRNRLMKHHQRLMENKFRRGWRPPEMPVATDNIVQDQVDITGEVEQLQDDTKVTL